MPPRGYAATIPLTRLPRNAAGSSAPANASYAQAVSFSACNSMPVSIFAHAVHDRQRRSGGMSRPSRWRVQRPKMSPTVWRYVAAVATYRVVACQRYSAVYVHLRDSPVAGKQVASSCRRISDAERGVCAWRGRGVGECAARCRQAARQAVQRHHARFYRWFATQSP